MIKIAFQTLFIFVLVYTTQAQCPNEHTEETQSIKICLEEGWSVKTPGEKLILTLPEKTSATLSQSEVNAPPNVKVAWKEKFSGEIDPNKTVLFRESYPGSGAIIRTALYKSMELFVSTAVITKDRSVVYIKLMASNSAEKAHKDMEALISGLEFISDPGDSKNDKVNSFQNELTALIGNFESSSPLLITKALIMKDAPKEEKNAQQPDIQTYIDRWMSNIKKYSRQLSQYESYEVTFFKLEAQPQQAGLPKTYLGELFVTPKDFVEPLRASISATEIDGKIYLMNISLEE